MKPWNIYRHREYNLFGQMVAETIMQAQNDEDLTVVNNKVFRMIKP